MKVNILGVETELSKSDILGFSFLCAALVVSFLAVGLVRR